MEKKIKTITIRSDGAARGNPGPAALGVIIRDANERVLASYGRYIGEATNNVAEYEALISALKTAKRYQAEQLIVLLDSELLVKQLKGEYRVKNAGLKPLYASAINYLSHYSNLAINHVPRSENHEADNLANQAIDDHQVNVEDSSSADGAQGKLF